MDAITSFIKNARKEGSRGLHRFDSMARQRTYFEEVIATQKDAERLKAEFAKKHPGVKFNFVLTPTTPTPAPTPQKVQTVQPKKASLGAVNYPLNDKSIVKITALVPGGLIFDAKDLPLKTGSYTLQAGDIVSVENGKIKTVEKAGKKQFAAVQKPVISRMNFAKIEAATKNLISVADEETINNLRLKNDDKGALRSFIDGLKKLVK